MAAERPRARRSTRQLSVVLEAVRSSGVEHPSADRVFARVRRVLPRISLGTVYRNLQRLAEEGRIGVTYLEGRVARYDPTPATHDHFVCEACGRIEDLAPSQPVTGLRAARRAGHLVTSHAYVLTGRCRSCRTSVAS
ncbi:MAG TPA: transcriptional repressor [Candidatus Limnocylindria bacterium]|jgi:Fe2+ or Zn2+ uptake regulation protein|nr:transcriptional repressor [Candidatus Limnocylindria bacterium]